MHYQPPLSERSDKELFNIISNDVKWIREIQDDATIELRRRKYSVEQIHKEKNKRIAILENYELRKKQVAIYNKAIGYSISEMLVIVLTFPLHIFFLHRFIHIIKELAAHNYHKKLLQHVCLSVISIILWLLIVKLIFE